MFDGRWRSVVERRLEPVGSGLRRAGISADLLTTAGVVFAGAAAVAVGSGRLGWGVVLLVASALPDLLDGAVAKAAGTASARGAFFDSVADRVTDALLLGGVGWYLASSEGSHAALLPFAVMGASMLVSYQRARAESLGLSARGGLMERAERVGLLAVGLAFHVVLVPVLWVMLVLTLVTAVQRFVRVWRQATAPRHGGDRRSSARWRGWRPGVEFSVDRRRPQARWRSRRAVRLRRETGRRRERARP
jgi:CDP-diacylglycerol--glycerol-3-phosphate 3-phosphatidyltransferase